MLARLRRNEADQKAYLRHFLRPVDADELESLLNRDLILLFLAFPTVLLASRPGFCMRIGDFFYRFKSAGEDLLHLLGLGDERGLHLRDRFVQRLATHPLSSQVLSS